MEGEVRVRVRALVGALFACFLLLLSPAALAAGPYPPPGGEGGGVSDTRVESGGCVTFSGFGFAPGSSVTITDNGGFVATTNADSQGDFSYEVCFGADAGRGQHSLVARGLGADGQPLTVSATVFVTGVSQRPGPSGNPGGGTQTGHSSNAEGQALEPSAQPTSAPSTPPGSHRGPQADRSYSGLGLTGWGILLGSLSALALFSGFALLAARRRRSDDDDLPAPV